MTTATEEQANAPNPLDGCVRLIQKISRNLHKFIAAGTNQNEYDSVLESMHLEAGYLAQLLSAQPASLPLLGRAVVGLIKSMRMNAYAINSSSLATLCQGLDSLRLFLKTSREQPDVHRLPITVLVVEDDPVCRRTMDLSLGRGNLHVTTCESGYQALGCLRGSQFDVVFSDIMMPGMDGFGFATEMRKFPSHHTTPLIFVTALSDFGTRAQSALRGGCDFIAKPIIPCEIFVKALCFALKGRAKNAVTAATHHAAAPDSEPSLPQRDATLQNPPEMIGVVTLTSLGIVKSVNERGIEILGLNERDMVGLNFGLLLGAQNPNALPEEITPEFMAAAAKQGTRFELRSTRGSFKGVGVQVKLSECHHSEGAAYVAVFQAETSYPAR